MQSGCFAKLELYFLPEQCKILIEECIRPDSVPSDNAQLVWFLVYNYTKPKTDRQKETEAET